MRNREKGKQLVRDGSLEIDGRIPCNTGGGLVGFGHPVGATGVKQILKIYRQMKGQCGDYQMSKVLHTALLPTWEGTIRQVSLASLRIAKLLCRT